ncbi:hypothetical protein A3H10_03290 [Candidatus Uhrbacteria bacterium RIFCSPLOWO2_12_FULL_46_10]|uniref:Uncharacterized protein n=1 Tax=Candidatus Uhrbacteria bacterium RIFCSPLOWO2_01_FULL_47_25 TaxID=1802402 RepID=A0A1F7UWW1_9BACT|nr:MAG: hypothetical protein UX68_C0014G0018 [Parcubacteria group bacterium GW2011_GWA2_46_9]OGL59868.1 MAG: hypothetical protein A2752_03945 [Candidatus Uhrbacteria bacterium RIFCSPHIGHO2_01_FULL_46_23]OGL70031.1 MAG: hypothetical protein A3D60_05110 [Candidatus Uhrbacteria bacterium RIFCSPHIGHO2_02_FULL_47_29]OGL76619.1 MAG: hypothetical protein A3E96_00535 [Candidatus Uhrbacteria bacterium RIFCSPHIGHO2_12_FULL_46_13]OGL82780.1 MAG: hypothetical protein A2936_05600 [Candidatus Uhrbacteria bac
MPAKTYHITRLAPFVLARTNALIVGTLGVLNAILQIILGTYPYLSGGKTAVSYLKFLGAAGLEGFFTIITSLIVGWVIGLVVSVVYNWWVKFVGGIKIDLDDLGQ